MTKRRPVAVLLRPLGLGDFLTGVPAYRAVARAFPGHRLVLAAPKRYAALAPLVGCIDDVVDTAPLAPLPAALLDADVAVNLHGKGPQSHRVLLGARPRRMIAFSNIAVRESRGGARWYRDEHEVERWCRMLRHAGVRAEPRDLRLQRPQRIVPRRFRDATIVHPGAASGARRWPLDRWERVVRELEARGHTVIVTGTQDEARLALDLTLRSGLPHRRCIAGKTTLLDLTSIVAHARLLVASDTGVAHLATAYARPSVVLFGPTAPTQWGPPRSWRHRVVWAGRIGDPHADGPDTGLLEITPADVTSAIDDLDRMVRQQGAA